MRIYNSLSRKIEDFEPIDPPRVGMYTCGPTVYDYAHIGHGRKYVMDDVLKRTLKLNGFEVKHVMNITDVGHLVSDADEGEDKLEKGAKKFGKTVWEVAEFFTRSFEDSMALLNIIPPEIVCKATEHIPEQIAMIEKLIAKGFAYDTPEAVYFDVSKFKDYGKLFGQNLDEKQVAVRDEVETGAHKANPVDFALWFKRIGKFENHTMHWESPWGDGFPGWHIECSAMSMKYLGEQFDIHTGGEDHKSIHHPNEIAQSEAATGKKPFVKYWIHQAFLTVDGKKMSKSLGNVYRVEDIAEKGFDSLALRYLFLTTHYRKQMNFTFVSLEAAETGLTKLRRAMGEFGLSRHTPILNEKVAKEIVEFRQQFNEALSADLNTPEAMGVVFEVVKSHIPDADKFELIKGFDEVLGLELDKVKSTEFAIPAEVQKLLEVRNEMRKERKWAEADDARKQIEELGFIVLDTPEGVKIEKR